MKPKQDNNFWPAYSDLMTSLFFVMLVLFVLSFVYYQTANNDVIISKNNNKQLNDSIEKTNKRVKNLEKKLEDAMEMKKIKMAFKNLSNKELFNYLQDCERIELNVDIEFEENQYDIYADYISEKTRNKLIQAGKELEKVLDTIGSQGSKYLLVIEGRSGKFEYEQFNKKYANSTKDLSFVRAKALYNFWKSKGVNFNEEVVEVILAGSGFEGKCRNPDESKNRTFIIRIMPVIKNTNYE